MKNIIILLILLLTSCQKEDVITTTTFKDKKFNQNIENSTWVIKEIEFQNEISYYNDTLKFLKGTILIYNADTTSYEFYITGPESYHLRLKESPVGYIDTDITNDDLILGKLDKHTFYNVYVLSNKYKITLTRLK